MQFVAHVNGIQEVNEYVGIVDWDVRNFNRMLVCFIFLFLVRSFK
jgi:hypothetical protein